MSRRTITCSTMLYWSLECNTSTCTCTTLTHSHGAVVHVLLQSLPVQNWSFSSIEPDPGEARDRIFYCVITIRSAWESNQCRLLNRKTKLFRGNLICASLLPEIDIYLPSLLGSASVFIADLGNRSTSRRISLSRSLSLPRHTRPLHRLKLYPDRSASRVWITLSAQESLLNKS